MKKCFAILLLAVMCFNWGGYQAVVAVWQQRADQHMQEAIDAGQYQLPQLVELRVSIDALPYTPAYQDWEWAEGELLINGVHHKYVQRKFEGGEMVLRCLPNYQKKWLQQADEKLQQDLNTQMPLKGGKQSSPGVQGISNYIGDYDDLTHSWQLQHPAADPTIASFPGYCPSLPKVWVSDCMRPPAA